MNTKCVLCKNKCNKMSQEIFVSKYVNLFFFIEHNYLIHPKRGTINLQR